MQKGLRLLSGRVDYILYVSDAFKEDKKKEGLKKEEKKKKKKTNSMRASWTQSIPLFELLPANISK